MQQSEKKTIYEQLGGAAAIDTAVDKFYDKVLSDPVVKDFFKNTNMTFQRRHQKNFITFVTGGPNIYKGKNLRVIHKKMGLQDIHFDHIKQHLGDTLLELGIEKHLVDKVMELIESLRPEVLNRPVANF